MSVQKIKNFFYYAIIFQIFILITVLISILFADFAMREYFIKDIKNEISKLEQSQKENVYQICHTRMKRLLKNINNCVIDKLAADPDTNLVKTKEEFEHLVVRKVRECQVFTKLTKNMRLYIYSKISDKVLPIESRSILYASKDAIQYRNNLTEEERKFIDHVIKEIDSAKSNHIWEIVNNGERERFLYTLDIIPTKNRGFEFYLPQFFSEPSKSMQYITIVAVPFTDMIKNEKIANHIRYLQNKIKKFGIVMWIMRVLAVIYLLSQVTMILMEIKLRNVLISEFSLRINNDSA